MPSSARWRSRRGLGRSNAGCTADRRLQFRIGIHLGDVAVRGGDLLGDGVNIAARLEGLAEPGGVCLSEAVHAFVRKALPSAYTDLGEQQVKGFDEPVRAFRVAPRIRLTTRRTEPIRQQAARYALPWRCCPSTYSEGDSEADGLADGIAEDIITELSRISGLAVIARNSTFIYKGRAVDVKQAARDLSARYVIEGSIRQSGQRVRITAQLIEGPTGSQVWAERYDRDAAESFELQDEVTRSVVASAQMHILLHEGLLIERSGKADLSISERATRG